MGLLQLVYIGIAAIMALLCIISVIREKDCPAKALSLGIVAIPLILRALSIK